MLDPTPKIHQFNIAPPTVTNFVYVCMYMYVWVAFAVLFPCWIINSKRATLPNAQLRGGGDGGGGGEGGGNANCKFRLISWWNL